MHNDVNFPAIKPISPACKNIIKKLLHKNESRRLGSRAGAADVKAHAFFANLRWALLRNTVPPISPSVGLDEKSFRSLHDSLSLDLNQERLFGENEESMMGDMNPFEGFESSMFFILGWLI